MLSLALYSAALLNPKTNFLKIPNKPTAASTAAVFGLFLRPEKPGKKLWHVEVNQIRL